MLRQDPFCPPFLSHGSRANAKKPIDLRMIDNKITPIRENGTAIAMITITKVARITVPVTRALSSTAVQSERKAWTAGKPSPNDMPRSALENRKRIIP
jgi:hypothetical protein